MSPDYILYDLLIYRMDEQRNKRILVDVTQQNIQSNYETQQHITQETSDPGTTIYIMEVTLYRQNMLETRRITPRPLIKCIP